MNPLQRYLLMSCEADPSGAVSLTDFMDGYYASLDGTEDARWHRVPHVLTVLAKRFAVSLGVGNRRIITGLRVKPVNWPTVDAIFALAEVA